MGKHYVFSKAQLEQALVDAKSMKQVIQNLGLTVNNGKYRIVKAHFVKAGLEVPKFDNVGHNNVTKHKFVPSTDEEFFIDGHYRNGRDLRIRMIKSGFSYVCSECGQLPIWNGKPLVIQVDHIDGNRFDNRKTNLRFLCPHCHTQTDTFGNNSKSVVKHYKYCECGVKIHKTSLQCRACAPKNSSRPSVIDWPPAKDVLQLVQDTNFTQAGKTLGVTDNAVRKYLKRNGLM